MKSYIIYDTDGTIIKKGTGGNDFIENYDSTSYNIIEGVVDVPELYYVDSTGLVVLKTESMLEDDLYVERLGQDPTIAANLITGEMDNDDAEEFINDYFGYDSTSTFGATWLISNYEIVRQSLYPPVEDYIEAVAGISYGSEYASEGETNLTTFANAYIGVKLEYPSS